MSSYNVSGFRKITESPLSNPYLWKYRRKPLGEYLANTLPSIMIWLVSATPKCLSKRPPADDHDLYRGPYFLFFLVCR